jgi:hypothetical protein
MGKIKYLNVSLTRPNAVYIAGETIEGKLTFDVSERLKINSIKLNYKGYAYVHW